MSTAPFTHPGSRPARLSFTSFVRYDRRLAAFVWPPVSLIHRQVALALVRGAARTI